MRLGNRATRVWGAGDIVGPLRIMFLVFVVGSLGCGEQLASTDPTSGDGGETDTGEGDSPDGTVALGIDYNDGRGQVVDSEAVLIHLDR